MGLEPLQKLGFKHKNKHVFIRYSVAGMVAVQWDAAYFMKYIQAWANPAPGRRWFILL